MSLGLVDIGRFAVTPESDLWLKIQTVLTGETKQQILRDLIHAHALKQLDDIDRAANLKAAHTPRNGHATDAPRNDDGSGRNTPT